MDDHTKELKRMYAVNKTRSLELYRKKTACGLSKQLEEELEELGEYLNAFYMHVLWKRTNGEEGTPWPYDPKSEEIEQLVPQVQEDALSSIINTPSILEETSPPHTTILASENDNGIDEEIIVESPHIPKIEHAHHDAISSTTTLEPTNCTIDSSCDDHAYLLIDSNVEDAETIDQLSCSCDEHIICMNCIDRKCHLLVQFREHALHNTMIAIRNEHESFEEGESSPSGSVDDKFENDQSIGFSDMHVLHDVEIHPTIFPTPHKSEDNNDDFHLITSPLVDTCAHECFNSQILSCDLPPDILGHDCGISCVDLNHVVDKRVVLVCDTTIVTNHIDFVIASFDRCLNVVDFIGCEKHLLSYVPKPKLLTLHTPLCHFTCANSFHGFKYFDSCGVLGVGSVAFVLANPFQAYHLGGSHIYHLSPSLLDHLLMEPRPPPRRTKLILLLILLSSYKPP